jgi:acylphosphatase
MASYLLIEGRVQGVGYRASFAAQARMLGLAGWVRNRHDGAVEACVSGTQPAEEAIIAWAQQGPPAAQVNQVQVSEADEASVADGPFAILPTA